MPQLHGCDVSTFQDPGLVNWLNYDFGIARATYGTSPDTKTKLHAEKIRAAGKKFGLYHFFLPTKDIQAQFDSFCAVAESVSFSAGDIIPCVDIEAYPDQFKNKVPSHYCNVSPTWNTPLQQFIGLLEAKYGLSMPYITQRDWSQLGSPQWVLDRPLWVANYPKTGSTSPLKAPATPGNKPFTIWQWLVGPLGKPLQDPGNPKAVDQNITFGDALPLIGSASPVTAATKVETSPNAPTGGEVSPTAIPYAMLTDDDWAEMQSARDRQFTEESA
jgi:hypothetical protein